MTDTNVHRFKITMPILKTRSKVVKDENGNEVEERYVEGVASGTDKDLHGDKMSPEAIESMAKSLKQHIVNLNNEHDTSWSSEIGDITALKVADNNDLVMEAKLNKMSSAQDLWYALTEQNKKLGLSIGGYVKDYEMVKEESEEEEGKGDWVRLYKEIDFDHIAVTSRPAYPKAWVSTIAKSIEDDEKSLMKKDQKKSKRSQKEKKLRELARSVARSIQNLEGDLLLELVYNGLTFLSDEQILLIERSLPMKNKKKDVSLEAEESLKKDEAEVQPEDDQEAENSAAPEDESSEDNSEVEEEAKEDAEEVTDADDEESSEEETEEAEKSEDSEETEEETEDEASEDEAESEESDEADEKSEDDSGEEESEEESAEKSGTEPSEKGELLKAVKKLTEGLEKALKSNEALSKRVEELEGQPSGRKTAEIEKGLGDDDSEPVDVETLKKERDEKIAELKKNHTNDPTLFSKIQRVRSEYSKTLGNE